MQDQIEQLILEAQRARFNERRTEPRHAFVRPVLIFEGDALGITGFSRDLSTLGMGVVVDRPFDIGSIAVLKIHSTISQPVYFRSEVRWCDPYGKGWHLIGWKFLSVAAPPAAALRTPRPNP